MNFYCRVILNCMVNHFCFNVIITRTYNVLREFLLETFVEIATYFSASRFLDEEQLRPSSCFSSFLDLLRNN